MGFHIKNPEDKMYFRDINLIISEFFVGINNEQELDRLKNKVLKHLEDVEIRDNNERDNDLGSTYLIGKIKIKSIGTEGAKTKDDYRKVIHTLAHELMHAHIEIFQREQRNKAINHDIESMAGAFRKKKENCHFFKKK